MPHFKIEIVRIEYQKACFVMEAESMKDARARALEVSTELINSDDYDIINAEEHVGQIEEL